jgi:hypothetical protein
MGQKAIWNGDRFLITLANRRTLRQERHRQQISRTERKRLWAKRQSGTETGFYLPWHPIVYCTRASSRRGREGLRAKRQSGTEIGFYYLGTLSCISPGRAADKLERRKKLWAKKQSGTETGFYTPWYSVVHSARADSRR